MCKCTPIIIAYAMIFLVSAHHCFIFRVLLIIIFVIIFSRVLLIIVLFIIIFLIIIFMVRVVSFFIVILWLFFFYQEICFTLRRDCLLWMNLASIESQLILSMCESASNIGAFTIHFKPLAEHSLEIRRFDIINATILICA